MQLIMDGALSVLMTYCLIANGLPGLHIPGAPMLSVSRDVAREMYTTGLGNYAGAMVGR